jgi:hypothetical protein
MFPREFILELNTKNLGNSPRHEYSLVAGTYNVRYADYPGAPPLNNNSSARPPVWIFPSLC